MRLLSLDVLRGVAVILVLLGHVAGVQAHADFWQPVIYGGPSGVDLFFVLSGFLISGLLFREYAATGTLRVGRFLVRRGFKLYPALWCMIAVTALLQYLSAGRVEWGMLANDALFLQNYRGGWWPHTWSLAVEEHFYLSLPFLFLILGRRGFRLLPLLAVSSLVFCLEMRCLADAADWRGLMATHLRFDALMLGVLLQYLFQRPPFVRLCRNPIWAVAGILLFVPSFAYNSCTTPWIGSIGLTLRAVGSGCLVAVFVARGVPATWPFRAIGVIGQHSYSIYLWHYVFLSWLPLSTALYLCFSIVAGIYLGRWIEQPMLKLRERIKWAATAAPAPSS